MKLSKNVFAWILTFVMVVGMMSSSGRVYAEESATEITPGNLQSPTSVNVNTDYTATSPALNLITKFTGTFEVYSFTLERKGTVTLEFARTNNDGVGKYKVFFNAVATSQTVSGVNSDYFIEISTLEKKTGEAKVLEAGSYKIIVNANPDAANATSKYSFKLNYVESTESGDSSGDSSGENTPGGNIPNASDITPDNNGSFTLAEEVTCGIEYSGSIYSALDDDYYRYTSPRDGKLSINLKHDVLTGNEDKNAFTIKVYEASSKVMMFSKSITGAQTDVTITDIGIPAQGIYYIVVSGNVFSVGSSYKIIVDTIEAANWEKERNNSGDTATGVELNTTYNGMLMSSDDVDFYKFVAPANGHFNVSLEHDVIAGHESSAAYELEVYSDSIGRNVISALDSDDAKGAVTSACTPEVAVKAGNTYYIMLRGNSYSKDILYKLTVKFGESEYWEQESNDTIGEATPIKSGKTYHGSIRNYSDVDYYRIELPKRGYISVNIKQSSKISGKIYKLTVRNYKDKKIYETGINGTDVNYQMAKLGLAKGTYYITVEKSGKMYSGEYTISAKAVSNANWEVEDNGDTSSSNTIKLGKTINGSTMSNINDTASDDPFDYYKLTINSSMYVVLNMSHEKVNGSSVMWYACLLDSKGKAVGGSGMYSKQAKTYTESELVFLEKGTYYVKVAAKDAGAGYEYKLAVNRPTAKAPAITKLQKSGKKIKLTWKVVPGATEYVIFRSTSKNGEYKRVKSVTSVSTTSWTDSKVKKGKTYYYKMRAVVKITDRKAKSSNFSKTKSIKLK